MLIRSNRNSDHEYDDLDRLTDVDYHDSDTEAFVMDALGNRTGNQTLRDDGGVNFTVDSATNRYTAIGGNSISHDDAGNLTVDKDGYQLMQRGKPRRTELAGLGGRWRAGQVAVGGVEMASLRS